MSRKAALREWLDRHRRRRAALFLVGGVIVLLLAAGAVLLVRTFLYYLLLLGVACLAGSQAVAVWGSWAMVILLFTTELFVGRKEIETLSVTTGTFAKRPVTVYLPGIGLASTVNPLAPDSAASLGKVIVSVLLFAPRLAFEGLRLFPRGLAYLKLDADGCAPVLLKLYKEEKKVPFTKLAADIPEGKEPEVILRQIVLIPGVLTLRSPPEGLSLVESFRTELGAWIRQCKEGKESMPET